MATTTIYADDNNYVNYNSPDAIGPVPSGWYRLQIGVDLYDTGYGYHGLCYSYIKFDLSSIPINSTILQVKLNIHAHYVRGDYVNWFMDVYDTINGWNSSSLSWNSQPGSSGNLLGTAELDGGIGQQNIEVTLSNSYFQSKLGGFASIFLQARDNPQSFSDSPSATLQSINDGNSDNPYLVIVYLPPSSFTPKIMII